MSAAKRDRQFSVYVYTSACWRVELAAKSAEAARAKAKRLWERLGTDAFESCGDDLDEIEPIEREGGR